MKAEKIKDLEQKYMKLLDFFLKSVFRTDLENAAQYINENYNLIQSYLSEKNKIKTPLERLISYKLPLFDKLNIKGIYPSPLSSDIAYELDDCYLNIDAKSVDLVGNEIDMYDISTLPNQHSFKNIKFNPKKDLFAIKGIKFDGYNYPTQLEPIINSKPVLSFIIKVIYEDNEENLNLKNMILQCIPNGVVTEEEQQFDLVENFKTYKYCKDEFGEKYKPKAFVEDHWVKIEKNTYYDNKTKNPKYNDDDCIWKKMTVGKERLFQIRIEGSSSRLNRSIIEKRINSEGKEWKGFLFYNLD